MTDNTTTKETNNKSSLSEAEKFLESLNLPDSQTQASNETTETDPNDIMSFLDEISNYPTEDTTSEEKLNEDDVKKGEDMTTKKNSIENQHQNEGGGGWKAWSTSFWSQASAAVDQLNQSSAAKKILESQVKKSIQNLMNKENIEKLGTGLKQLTTTLLETVAPPISEHELVEVWLSYDIVGYAGLEALVYRAFARVMEYTESGQVVVRNPNQQQQHHDEETTTTALNLNMCDSIIDGTKLAKANIDHLIKLHFTPSSSEKSTQYSPQSGALPVIHCPVFMSIQPVKMTMSAIDDDDVDNQQLMFIILMVDPTNKLRFKTYSQSVPLSWLNIPYEDNEWVEDKLADILRMSVTSIAQDYVWTRMSGNIDNKRKNEEVIEEI
ncbi:maintenance of telomere capping protein 1 [Cokeromyces recurvatus]|uniref:maintenance of telomere capping protein 1 n=1 Tax=Cokeromyces recurvatus TaxID=90255 RepID=UPI00221EEF26|nr:maintenance of telomere capping protein 1 [Cokeromyces recurvatus]KAI7905243.1 maintenance of telomere capping protein 1 [Cokeromyces recurvatus]